MPVKKSMWLCMVTFICTLQLFAQTEPVFETYDWEENPTKNFDVSSYTDKDLVAFKEVKINEFVFIDDGLLEYSIVHNIYWLNSNDAIEEYNKVYLPFSETTELVKNKARVITKEGKIIELDDSKILEAKNEETKVTYKFYALEGIEKGSFIEYYYVVRRFPGYTGVNVVLQDDYLKKNVDFSLYAPKNLIFSSKSYNDLPELELDTLTTEKNHWKLHLKELEAVEEESQSPYYSSLKRFVYKLDRNTANPTKEIVAYNLVSQNLYKSVLEAPDKNTKKLLSKFIKNIKNFKKEITESDIRQIESYIKSNVFVTKARKEGINSIENIIENKIAGENGIVKLYAAIFKELGVKMELVLTTDRTELKFDKEFEAYNFLKEYLIFFPEFKKYIEPLNAASRLGFPTGVLTDNYGLFIKEIKVGEFTSALGKIKYINPVNYDKTNYNLVMNVSFDSEDFTITNLEMNREMDGYYSLYLQPYLYLAKPEGKDEAIEGVIKSINPDIEIKEKEVFNAGKNDFGEKPLIIKAKMTSEAFVEKAGRKYLFKLGDLIGPQQEMYQEQKRKLPVENDFERSYDRKLIVEIPEGYEFKNLEDININESYKEEDTELFMFKSSYEIKDGKLVVSIKEYYNQNIVPVAIYENYRKVINSAADFNKVTLVLDKI